MGILTGDLASRRLMDLKGEGMEIRRKTVFITGVASGIGRATAVRMAREGARLFLTDINQVGLDETCRLIESERGEVSMARAFDVADYQAMRDFADDVHAGYGSLDILVNVAGIALFSQVEDMRHEDWDKVIRVNLWGPVHGIECFVPEMIRLGKEGHIVNVSSTAGLIGLPWHAAYAASKHALVGISEVLRYDLKKHHIGVSVICPGAVDTGMVQSVEIHAPKSNIDALRTRFLKVAIPPEKVASLIVEAIIKQRFLVITSADIKVLYFLKRVINPLFHLIMQLLTRIMDRGLLGKG
jgi:NAD(P)-dependent dehydrogenase (short-subunit alcohol dehydrogenase family)